MDRIEQIRELVTEIRKVTLTHSKYMSIERDYFEGERLFMREAHMIVEVGEMQQPTMSELAQRLDVTPGAVSQLAVRMEKKGFIKRIQDTEDKRQNIVCLTEKGMEFFQHHKAFGEEQYRKADKILAEYSMEQLEEFIRFEEKVNQLFQQY